MPMSTGVGFLRPKGIDWDSQPLGDLSDTDLANMLGVDRSAVTGARKRRGISRFDPGYVDWDSQPLGVVHDSHIAKKLGVSESAVNAARRRRGIRAVVRENTWEQRRRKGAWKWYDWSCVPLGKKTDEDIAEEIGTTRQVVSRARRSRNIKPYFRNEIQCPCGKLFVPRSENDRFCSIECSRAVHGHRFKHRDRGCMMDEVVASLARMRREVSKRRSG